MTSTNLFQIDNRINEILQSAVDPETGEIHDEDMIAELDRLEMERPQKIENSALFIKSQRALAKAIAAEITALRARKDTAERLADSTERYLLGYMGDSKFSTPKVAISWKHTQAVKVVDLSKIPKEYLRFKDPEPNKQEISKVLKSGGEVEGAALVANTSIVLK